MKKKFILIIIAIVIILIIIAVIILIQKDEPISDITPLNQEEVSEEISSETEKEKEQVDQTAVLKSQLGLQARSFIARYGTYSSDNRYENLNMLLPQMSAKLAQKIVEEIAIKEEKQQGFFSSTTRIINLNLKSFDEKVEIVFIAQAQEQKVQSGQTNLIQKIIELSFVKENNQWKVDNIIFN